MKRSFVGVLCAAVCVFVPACAMLEQGDPATGSGARASGGEKQARVGSGATAAGASGSGSSAANRRGKTAAGDLDGAHPSSKASAEPAPAPGVALSKAEQFLADGTELYEKGDFKGAIRKLQGARDSFADNSTGMQQSLKYLAFSYCVTGQRSLCKAQFVGLLKIAPEFQLSRAESGHPLWGPVFKEARAAGKVAAAPAGAGLR